METELILFIVVGFAAQMIDGALGMAYGVSCTTLLLSLGVSPAAASASVHTAEVATTAASGWSHLRHGNINRLLFRRLVIPGMIGGVVGAYVLSSLPGDRIKPFVSLYLLIMGVIIIRKAFHKVQHKDVTTRLKRLGLTSGFMDAVGGGGWGPIVTSTLLANGNHPRYAIGSVNAAEFFVTTAQAAAFFITLGLIHWEIIVGLMIGGVLAAPLAARACKRVPAHSLMVVVGVLIVVLSLRSIYQSLI